MPHKTCKPILAFSLGVLLIAGGGAPAKAAQLKGLWPSVTSTAAFDAAHANCAAIPAPVLYLATDSRYDQTDDARTTIDPARSKAYEAEVAPVRAFARSVVSDANDFVLSGGKAQELSLIHI
jgi:hypothetical protein